MRVWGLWHNRSGNRRGSEMGIGKYFNPAQREALLATTLSGVTGMATVGLLYAHDKRLIFLSGILVAVTLFFWRIRFRFLYGVIELAFGLYVLWYVADKGRGSFSAAFSTDFDTFQLSVVLIQTFGAIYILIRSFDNLLQGLPTNTRVSIETRLQQWHV
jgi:hypothetical protein